MIGVVTASTQMFSEKPDARELGNAVISGIEASGGIAVRWDTTRSPDLMAWGHAESFSFAWRDQLADFIESWTRQQSLDGLALVGDAPETLAGMAMAAARLNVPAILVTTGPNRWEFGSSNGADAQKKKIFSDPFMLITETLFKDKKAKKKEDAEHQVDWFRECLLTKDNHAANSIDLVLEALGVCLPGMSTAPSQSARRHELAFSSGERVIALVKGGQSFRRFLCANAFSNAIRLNAALGGSVDVAVHLMALAHEAGMSLPLDLFDRIARETPQICRLGGVGEKEAHRIEDLDRAGGVWAILNTFRDSVLPTTTINGKGASELAKSTVVKDPQVIMSRRPYHKESGVGVLRGNLALNGAVFLLNQVVSELAVAQGPVALFENEIEAAEALCAGRVKKGSLLVVRGQGPRGGPGLHKLRVLPALIQSRGWNKVFPLITDGRLPDTPAGLFVSLVSPESAMNGPMAVLRAGDWIDVDTKARQLSVRLTETDLRVRMARWQSPEPKMKRGFLDRYSRSVSEVHEGAVLK
jgi:dihydroxy-acid dehydratase